MADPGAPSLHTVVEFDVEELDFHSALTGLVVLAVVVVAIGTFGPAGMAAGIAALFVIAEVRGIRRVRGLSKSVSWFSVLQ